MESVRKYSSDLKKSISLLSTRIKDKMLLGDLWALRLFLDLESEHQKVFGEIPL